MPEDFKLGRGARIDEGVRLGYPCERLKTKSPLVIGHSARVRSGTVIYQAAKIGDFLETGHNVVIREENNIGDRFSVWSGAVIDYGCKIGNNVKIHSNCYVAQFTVMEDDVFLAPGVTIANDIHPGCRFSKECMRGPTIKKGAKIGVNCTILPYVVIGEGSLIGAGSVVTRDVPANAVAFGNPACAHKGVYELECEKGFLDKPYRKGKR